MAAIKKGNQVRLKGNELVMVVEQVGGCKDTNVSEAIRQNENACYCTWQSKNKKYGEWFDPKTLELYAPEAPSLTNF